MIGTSWNVSSVRPSKSNHGTQTVPGARFELVTQWSEAQHATAGLRRPPGIVAEIDAS